MLRTMIAGAWKFRPRAWSVASQLFAAQAAITLVVLIGVGAATYWQTSSINTDAAQDEVLAVARAVAATPAVRDALDDPDPAATLQPLAEQIRRDTGTDFVVVMSVTGRRYSHPNPAAIGGQFIGHTESAARGQALTETYTGTLGPSVRAVVPVTERGQVRGLVSVGITVSAVKQELAGQLPLLLGATAIALAVAGLGSWLTSRWLRRTTHDLGPAELSRMYEFYDAVLHAVREGLLLLDGDGRVVLVNDEARRLLDLSEDVFGQRIDEIGLPSRLGIALAAGGPKTDEVHLTADRVLLVSHAPARWAGRHLGTVTTLRDHTELRALVSELKTVRGFAESLHAQAHEAANQLHTVISLIELGRGEEALRFATAELAVAQQLTDLVIGSVEDAELSALLLGKAAQASQRGVELVVDEDIILPAGVADPRDLVTIFGNLIDNALDAVSAAPAPRRIEVSAGLDDTELVLRVADNGPGLDPSDVPHAFQRGWSTKNGERGLGRGLGLALVGQAVHRYGGTIDIIHEDGAAFTVRLPLRPAAEPGSRPWIPASAPALSDHRPPEVSVDQGLDRRG